MSSARTPLIQRNQGGDIPWRRIWSFVSPFALPQTVKLQATATFSLVMVVLSKLAALLQPYAYKLAVDDLAIMAEDGKYHVPYGAVALYVFAQVFAHALNCAQNYSYSLVSADCTKRFGVAMFRKLQNLSLAFHLQRRTGEVTRIMDRGINSIDIVVNTVIFTIIPTYVSRIPFPRILILTPCFPSN